MTTASDVTLSFLMTHVELHIFDDWFELRVNGADLFHGADEDTISTVATYIREHGKVIDYTKGSNK